MSNEISGDFRKLKEMIDGIMKSWHKCIEEKVELGIELEQLMMENINLKNEIRFLRQKLNIYQFPIY